MPQLTALWRHFSFIVTGRSEVKEKHLKNKDHGFALKRRSWFRETVGLGQGEASLQRDRVLLGWVRVGSVWL